MQETRDSLKIEKIELPKKDAGSIVEAAYLNGIFEQVEKSINGLIDAQILFEGAASHRVQGLQVKPEGSEESIYVTELDKDTFHIKDAETISKYAISITDIINEFLWTNTDEHGNIQALSKATEYAWILCKQEIMDLWKNKELLDNIKKEVLEKLLEDIQEQIRLVYRKKVETELFEFRVFSFNWHISDAIKVHNVKHHANKNGDVPTKDDFGKEIEHGVLAQAVIDSNPGVSINNFEIVEGGITLSTEDNTGTAVLEGIQEYMGFVTIEFTYANFVEEKNE